MFEIIKKLILSFKKKYLDVFLYILFRVQFSHQSIPSSLAVPRAVKRMRVTRQNCRANTSPLNCRPRALFPSPNFCDLIHYTNWSRHLFSSLDQLKEFDLYKVFSSKVFFYKKLINQLDIFYFSLFFTNDEFIGFNLISFLKISNVSLRYNS